MSKLAISNIHKTILNNRSKDKKNENLIRTLNIRENIPFTNRESKNLNNDYMSILNSKIRKIKSFNKRISNSISSKKNFIQNISSNNLSKESRNIVIDRVKEILTQIQNEEVIDVGDDNE